MINEENIANQRPKNQGAKLRFAYEPQTMLTYAQMSEAERAIYKFDKTVQIGDHVFYKDS